MLNPGKTVTIKRIAFHEITKDAIRAAIANPRDIDEALVEAQETRRVLDRLLRIHALTRFVVARSCGT